MAKTWTLLYPGLSANSHRINTLSSSSATGCPGVLWPSSRTTILVWRGPVLSGHLVKLGNTLKRCIYNPSKKVALPLPTHTPLLSSSTLSFYPWDSWGFFFFLKLPGKATYSMGRCTFWWAGPEIRSPCTKCKHKMVSGLGEIAEDRNQPYSLFSKGL